MFEHLDELETEASERSVTLAQLLAYRPALEVARLCAELVEAPPTSADRPAHGPLRVRAATRANGPGLDL